ncbi:MAG: YifB family Mg chelatase-like AAA ATPase [Candidatus Roizmanbacteria bacterium]
MLSFIKTGTTIGLEGVLIDAQIDVAERGFPTFTIVGLPTKGVDEAKDRIRSAIFNSGFEMPDSRITINLAPADIPKQGSAFDLPMAIGILCSTGALKQDKIIHSLFIGELSLDGKIRRVPGVISIALMARKQNIDTLYVPLDNALEASYFHEFIVIPVNTLQELILHLNEEVLISPSPITSLENRQNTTTYIDFKTIKGQYQAKRAMEIAGAGGHNIHLKGVPGAGKTLLSRAFPGILPEMVREEILEVSQIYSVIGQTSNQGFILERPFRSPHHTTSRIGLIGGGSMPGPGEISLAHRGILFLDEFPEFPRSILESLRQPMEDGEVTISRAAGTLRFPCRFLLVAASNPCPCGNYGHPTKKCICISGSILRYQKRLSGPLLDRIDLHITIPPVDEEKLMSDIDAEDSLSIRERVQKAREIQTVRFQGTKIVMNSEMTSHQVKQFCKLEKDAEDLLRMAYRKLSLSARSYFKVIKVARTIADLKGEDKIESTSVAEALQYRPEDI